MNAATKKKFEALKYARGTITRATNLLTEVPEAEELRLAILRLCRGLVELEGKMVVNAIFDETEQALARATAVKQAPIGEDGKQ